MVNEKGHTHQQAADCLDISLSAIRRWPRDERGSVNPSGIKIGARGNQYASHEYPKQMSIMKIKHCMSQKGNCWDNSPTERFFRSLKHGQLNYERIRTKGATKLSVVDYLAFYNGKRSQSKLGYQSPLQFERDFYRKAV